MRLGEGAPTRTRGCFSLALMCLATGMAAAAEWPAPLQGLEVFAWLGSWAALENSAVSAPTTPGMAQGALGPAFEAEWTRQGDQLHVRVTRLTDAWCGRLGVQAVFRPEAERLDLGYNDVPVAMPLPGVKRGQIWWTWGVGVPWWVTGTAGGQTAGLVPETSHHHGCFALRSDDRYTVQLCLDSPAVGESVEMALRLVSGLSGEDLRAQARAVRGLAQLDADPPPAGSQFRDGDFVRVDGQGRAFVTADGPFVALGRNQADLPTLPPEEQERFLQRVLDARMSVIRVLLPDCVYRPLPGEWNDAALARLRDALDRCAARGVRVIVCLEYSAAGHQYSCSTHLSPSPGDLYLLPQTDDWYAELVRRVVEPLRDHPAVMAWDVTNEPSVPPDSASLVLLPEFRQWLEERHGETELASLPARKEFDTHSTPAARDFFVFSNAWLARSLIARARAVRDADPNHLVTVSGWNPRLLRGHEGAEVFDFWAPHTYDLWMNGPEVSEHVNLLVGSLRDALPDRPRPVVIEEFGISEGPRYPDEMRAEHVRQFLEAGARWGAGGLLHWWEMSPAMEAAYRDAPPYAADRPAPETTIAAYLPPSQEWNLLVYDRYMTRREWARAVTTAREAGLGARFVGQPEEATGCAALLVLGTSLTPDEQAQVTASGLKVVLTPSAGDPAASLPDPLLLPSEREGQGEVWRGLGRG